MAGPAQSSSDLRSLVARRVGLKRRVALLGGDASLVRILEENGCVVLADPDSLLAVASFAPEVVVAFDGFAREGSGAENFSALAKAAPGAELVFSFANGASATALLQGLMGQPVPPTIAEPQVRGWLQSAGLSIRSRDVVIGPHQPTGLAVDAEAQLRQLLEQLNPDAGAERLLVVAKPGSPARAELPPEPGLLSVLVSAGDDLLALQGTLASLARQTQRPMQVVVATSASVAEAERVGRKQAERGAFALEVLTSATPDFAVRTNQALGRARGQYLAFLEAGDLVDRPHFHQLVRALEQGTSAWAIAGLRQPGVSLPPGAFSLADWIAAGAAARSTLLLDRTRLGPFPLTFAEGIAAAEPLFLARLSAIFPAATAGSAPSVERPTPVAITNASQLASAMKARPLRAIGPLVLEKQVVEGRFSRAGPLLRRWLGAR
jgi:hypothetical protein